MAIRKLTQRYSQIPALTAPLTESAYIPLAQGPGTVYRVPIGRIHTYFLEKVIAGNILSEGVYVSIGVTKEPNTSELKLDKDYLDSISIPIDFLDITIVGNINYGLFDITIDNNAGKLTFVNEVYVLLDHKRGKIEAWTVIDVTPDSTGYIYLSIVNGVVTMSYATDKREETLTSTVMLEVSSRGGQVTYRGQPFSRLGKYRISRNPAGTAVPGSTGDAATKPITHWLKKQY